MIGVSGLSVSLGGRPVLRNIAFAAAPGELVAICGPNGAGKSTLLKALAGLLPPPSPPRPDPLQVAYLAQSATCAWPLTLREVAGLGRLPHGDVPGAGEAAVDRALALCGVADLAHRRIDRVSGGQARRALLARVLAGEPRVALLDEPVADLDPAAARAILTVLRNFTRAGGTVIAVLHALDLALAFADRMVVLAEGGIAADGPPRAVLPLAAEKFGMRANPAYEPLFLSHTGEI